MPRPMLLARRCFLLSTLALAAVGCAEKGGAPAAYKGRSVTFDAVVSLDPADKSGLKAYGTLAEALEAAPAADAGEYRIFLRNGTWDGSLTVAKPNVHLTGEDRRLTVIRSNTATQADGGGATLTVTAPDFHARNLTVVNAFDHLQQLKVSGSTTPATALLLAAGADRSVLENVDVASWQGTLVASSGRALFRRSRIAGAVAFVSGGTGTRFEECEIASRFRPGAEQQGSVFGTASGLVFDHSKFLADAQQGKASVTLLGGTAPAPAAVLLHSVLDEHLTISGSDAEPAEGVIAEFDSSGAGAPAAGAPGWRRLDAKEAGKFDADSSFGRWKTGS